MSDDYSNRIYLVSPGARPPFYEVVDHVYGEGANVDTEGDSRQRDSTDWTWLYMQLRSPPEDLLRENPVVEIVADQDGGDFMHVASDDDKLALKAASFLAMRTGANLTSEFPR